jgi:hypothetical protein
MITVEKALKSKKNNTKNLLEGQSEKKKSNKKILWVGLGLAVVAYIGYRMTKGKNEKVSISDT